MKQLTYNEISNLLSVRPHPENPPIVAVDFDGCLCNSRYPDLGEPISKTVKLVRKLHSCGAVIILWTCREGKSLESALNWCKINAVPIDYANENPPERVALWGNDCRKIGADLWIRRLKRSVTKSAARVYSFERGDFVLISVSLYIDDKAARMGGYE